MFVATHTATSRAAALAARRQSQPARDADDEEGENLTLGDAFETTMRDRWKGTRSERTVRSQARQAIMAVGAVAMQDEARQAAGAEPQDALAAIRLTDVTHRHVAFVVDAWRCAGVGAATINRRLTCLSLMGVDVAGRRQKSPRVLKWWLKPDVEAALVKRLAADGDQLMADYITWTTHTGLRVEESLALTRGAFSVDDAGGVSVSVPGLKTSGSQATLPLGEEAADIFRSRFAADALPNAYLFPVGYHTLLCKWNLCRSMIGVQGDPLATLKALRRSAARYLHITKGMPLDLVRNYLRHENIAITMEYLRLTGGYGTDEYRKWL